MPAPSKKLSHRKYPRGSHFYALANCDVSFQLSQASGEDPPTPFSDRGSEVHGVVAGKATDDEGIREEAILLQNEQAQKLLAWGLENKADGDVYTEKRLWMWKGVKPIYSGQPDEYIVEGRRAFLSEYKTGWHPLDDWTATNCQIRAYVPLIDADLKGQLDSITAAIIKPGKQSPPAVFDRDAIEGARAWAISVAERAMSKEEKVPNKGPWCKYCSGKVLCPLWRQEMISLADLGSAIASDVPDSMLRSIAPKLHLAKEVSEKLLARLYERVRAKPEFFRDWHFHPTAPRRKIEDVIEAYNALVVRNKVLSAGEFLVCTRLAVNDLEQRLRKSQNITHVSAKEMMNTLLAGIMEYKSGKDELVYEPSSAAQALEDIMS